MLYDIFVYKTPEVCSIKIEAESEDEAWDKAIALAKEGKLTFVKSESQFLTVSFK